jgi:hypothetical protein
MNDEELIAWTEDFCVFLQQEMDQAFGEDDRYMMVTCAHGIANLGAAVDDLKLGSDEAREYLLEYYGRQMALNGS